MQQSKGIKNLSELPKNGSANSDLIITMFDSTIKQFNLSSIFMILACCKTKGIHVKDIFRRYFFYHLLR